MRALRAAFAILALACALAAPAAALQPDEILEDPQLEQRARDISAHLRCLVCQNQSIDDSDAPLARDLRIIVRERLQAGDTNEEVVSFVVDRYGEFVLLKPTFSWHNALLWAAPVILLVFGGLIVMFSLRGRRGSAPKALTTEERQALDEVMGKGRRDTAPAASEH
ncbi:cytochrome c-type biogenesis protein [Lutibaculum baratangense]|nr:cytochrome c-type biogenesis protein [Lutibaculum baratangense]